MNIIFIIILALLLVIIIAGLISLLVYTFSSSNKRNKKKSYTTKHFYPDKEIVYNSWYDLFPSMDFMIYPDNSFSLIESSKNSSGQDCLVYSKLLHDIPLFTELCVHVIGDKCKNFVFKGKYYPHDVELLKTWIKKLFSFGANDQGQFSLSFEDYLYLKEADCYWSSSWDNTNLSAILSVTGDEVDLMFFEKTEIDDCKEHHLSFSVKGINKRTGIIAGEFDCSVSIEPSNIIDSYAIKIEDLNGSLLGYLPKGNSYLFDLLNLYCNGKTPGHIIIKDMYDEHDDRHYFIGIVDFYITCPNLDYNYVVGNRFLPGQKRDK